MPKACLSCERQNDIRAKTCVHCGESFGRPERSKPALDPRCNYESNGVRCPCIASMDIHYGADGQRHGLCRYHFRAKGDWLTGNQLLERFAINGPPASPKDWRDLMMEAMENGATPDEAREASRSEHADYLSRLGKIQKSSRISPDEKAGRIETIKDAMRRIPEARVYESAVGRNP